MQGQVHHRGYAAVGAYAARLDREAARAVDNDHPQSSRVLSARDPLFQSI